MDRNVTLTTAMGVERDKEQLFNRRVAQGQTADRAIASVNEDFTPRLLRIGADAVRSIGIIDPEREMIKALRVETVDKVKTFRDLSIAFAPFRTGSAGGRDNGPGADVVKRAGRFSRPQFEFAFMLESAQKNFAWRIRQLCGAKSGTNLFFAGAARLGETPIAFRGEMSRLSFEFAPDDRETGGGDDDEEKDAWANHRVSNLRCHGTRGHQNLSR